MCQKCTFGNGIIPSPKGITKPSFLSICYLELKKLNPKEEANQEKKFATSVSGSNIATS